MLNEVFRNSVWIRRSKIKGNEAKKESIFNSFLKVKDVKLPYIKNNMLVPEPLYQSKPIDKNVNEDFKFNSRLLRPNKSFIANLLRQGSF